MLQLRLLGSPALYRDGAVVALPIRKSMALLLLLACSAAPVPRARVAAMLWPDLEPATGRRNLRRELARLRESGADDAVAASGGHLALAAGVAVDAAAFIARVGNGRADEALASWHGPLADGFVLGDADAFDDWLAGEREQLGEQRRRALHAAAAAHEAAGDPARALDRVQSLLADDPLQERHHRDAMRLLAASGRREAALTQFERCRGLLQSELGLAPMAETEALAAALRNGSEAGSPRAVVVDAAAPPVAGRGTPTPLPEQLPFVGRTEAVAALEAAWSAARPIVIEGEAGMGKTRLATDFAAAHGPYALVRCRAGDAEVPYASFSRAMRVLLGSAPALPAEVPAWMTPEVARLIPELGATAAPIRTDEERNRFYEACASAWQALSAGDFDAVVIDDWHLADAASRALISFVVRRRCEAGGGGAREILALRPDLDDEAGEALLALRSATGAAHVRLQALSGGEVFDLVRRLAGGGEPTHFARRLEQATGGSPFFLAETLRHLADSALLTVDAKGGWQTPYDASTEDYREMPVPASVQDAVRARAQRLAPTTRRVLEAAALAAEPFSPRLLAPACALSELEAVLAIEDAVAARLLREHEHGGFAFTHDLVQQSLAASLSAERARLVHRRLALGAEAAGAAPAAIAAHHEASGDAPRAVAHRTAAGDEAMRLHALPEAIAQWTTALADRPTPAAALRLHERLVRASYRRTDYAAVRAQADAIGRLIEQADLTPDERLAAAIARGLALARAGNGAEALATLDALPGEPSGRQRFDALWARAVTMDELGRADQAGQATQSALALPDITDADRIELLDFAWSCEMNAGRFEVARRHADASFEIARRLGDGVGLARNHLRRGILLITVHDIAAAATELLAAADAAARLGLVQLERLALYNLTVAYAAQSQHAQGLAAGQRGWNLVPPMQASDFRVMYRLALLDSHLALGDLGACWREAEPAVTEALTITDPRIRIGAATGGLEPLGMLGEQALAQRLLAAFGTDDTRALKGPADEMWVARAEFELRYGDPAAAATALAELDAGGEIPDTRVRMRDALARAESRLVAGEALAAIALLPRDDAPGMNGEMRTRSLALSVRAQAASGRLDPATVASAQAVLAAPIDHAIATLALHTALARAWRAGVAGTPETAETAHTEFVAKLAATLLHGSTQRAAFEAAWA